MENRLNRLLRDFRWGRMDECFFSESEREDWRREAKAA